LPEFIEHQAKEARDHLQQDSAPRVTPLTKICGEGKLIWVVASDTVIMMPEGGREILQRVRRRLIGRVRYIVHQDAENSIFAAERFELANFLVDPA